MSNLELSRNEEIRMLRSSGAFSIMEIARMFSISKQRVHQIAGTFGFTYGVKKTKGYENVVNKYKKLSNGEIALMAGISKDRVSKLRNKLSINCHHKVDGGRAEIGEQAEIKLSKILNEMGIENILMGFRSPFDILLIKTGIRIDVKYTSRIFNIGGSINKPYNWRTHIDKKSSKYCDYFILCPPDFSFFVVIPFEDTHEIVRFCYPFPKMGRETKYSKYINAFDLLRLD